MSPETHREDRPCVLIAEDTAIEALTLARAVREVGAEPVGPVARAAQVVELSRERRVDAAVLDVNLGGDLVFAAADELVRRHVPVLFVSGYDRTQFPDRFQDEPWLVKPYALPDLEAKLELLLEQARQRRRTGGRRR